MIWQLTAARNLALSLSALIALGSALALLSGQRLGAGLILTVCISGALTLVGIRDRLQTKHAILRNYPIVGHFRFLFEEIRPELRQYLFESDRDGTPFARADRAIVYQRSKKALDKRPFGTQLDVYGDGYEWLAHSLAPTEVATQQFRVTFGSDCTQPYTASVLNISAMSFGALSANAIKALNTGARLGGFAHDTGEGGLSPYHQAGGGDIIWEIGSGYFGCRTPDGAFDPELFAKTASLPQVKMVELKLSQGAKPGHGGVLPAAKISTEISRIRGVPMGRDCVSPARHPAFSTPIEMMRLISDMRRLSGGKPAGFKLAIGDRREFMALIKAMLETGITPDFIVIDGKEGGTGAAPAEFIDHVGMPLREALTFAHNALVGANVRNRIRLVASGKIISAFDMVRVMALGADTCNMARGFMFSIGCIQSESCHTDRCPTGVATQDPGRQQALVVPDKAQRVAQFHGATLHALAELVAAAGLTHPGDIRNHHVFRRVSGTDVRTFEEIYPPLAPGALLDGTDDQRFAHAWAQARPDRFQA